MMRGTPLPPTFPYQSLFGSVAPFCFLLFLFQIYIFYAYVLFLCVCVCVCIDMTYELYSFYNFCEQFNNLLGSVVVSIEQFENVEQSFKATARLVYFENLYIQNI